MISLITITYHYHLSLITYHSSLIAHHSSLITHRFITHRYCHQTYTPDSPIVDLGKPADRLIVVVSGEFACYLLLITDY